MHSFLNKISILIPLLALISITKQANIKGCLSYANPSVCKVCNVDFNWVLRSGTCVCRDGYTKSEGCNGCIQISVGSGKGSGNTNSWSDSGSGKQKKCGVNWNSWSGSGKSKKMLKCGYCFFCDTLSGYQFSWQSMKCVCKTGFYNNAGTCSSCSSAMIGCSTCNSSNVCTSCISGIFYWNSSHQSCRPCSDVAPGCEVCTSGTSCNKCVSGYLKIGSSCIPCNYYMNGCNNCTSATICRGCDSSGFFRNVSGKCTCNANYVNRSGICTSCHQAYPGCLSCSVTGASDKCDSCDVSANFQLYGTTCRCKSQYTLSVSASTCVLCKLVIPGCVTCNPSALACTMCEVASGAYLGVPNANNICDCSTGYGKNSSGQCTICTDLFAGCSSCSSIQCINCLTTHFYNILDGSCIPCVLGCLNCNNKDDCSLTGSCSSLDNFQLNGVFCQCVSGYVLSSSGDGCVKCTQKLHNPGCLTCNSTQCISCSSGYYLNDYTKLCQSCAIITPGCLLCTVNSGCSAAQNCPLMTCTSCNNFENYQQLIFGSNCLCVNDYFVKDANGICVRCSEGQDPNCIRCNSLVMGSCLQCSVGFFRYENPPGFFSCKSCDDALGSPNCKQCQMVSLLFQCDSCYNPYYLDTSSSPICNICHHFCSSCVTTNSNCLTCKTDIGLHFQPLAHLGTCLCQVGYFHNPAGQCTQVCKDILPGCQSCSLSGTGVVCLSCNGTNFNPGVDLNFQCTCVSPFYALNGSQCLLCNNSFGLDNCIECSDNATCTKCQVGFFQNSGICHPCTDIVGCLQCFDLSTCLVALPGYFLSLNIVTSIFEVKTCNSSFPNCGECNVNQCKKCRLDSFALDPSHYPPIACYPCDSYSTNNPHMHGCINCQSSSICTYCDSTMHFTPDGNGGCLCQDTFALNQSLCKSCSDLMDECLNCIDKLTCIVCSTGYQLNFSHLCQPCSVGCNSCDPIVGCFQCDISKHFQTDGTLCKCSIGYQLASDSTCQTVCGDGIFMSSTESCDDGNTNNNDGCSSTCNVETDWNCSNHNLMKSTCGYQGLMVAEFKNITKHPYENQLTIVFSIGPSLAALNKMDFVKSFSSNLNLSNPKFVYNQDGTVSLTYNYINNLQGEQANFVFDPALASSAFYAVHPVSQKLTMTTNTNQPLTYYQSNTYSNAPRFKVAFIIGEVLSYIILGGGLFCDKIIGIQLFGVWQLAFFSLSNINYVQPLLSPLMQLNSLNGYNFKICSDCSTVPNRISAISHQSQISSNFNLMLILLVAEVGIAIIVFAVGRIATRYNQKLASVCKRMLKEYLLMITLFNTFNIGYSVGIQTAYGTPKAIDVFITIVSIIFLIGSIGGLSFTDKLEYAQFKSYLRSDWLNQSYFQITILYRFILGILMSQLNELFLVTIFSFFFAALFLMYQVINLPFKKGYQNYRAIIHQFSVIAILGISMYYRSMKRNQPISVSTKILSPAYFQIFALYLCVGISAGCLFYQLYLKYFKDWISKLSQYLHDRNQIQAKEVKIVGSETLNFEEGTFNEPNILWTET